MSHFTSTYPHLGRFFGREAELGKLRELLTTGRRRVALYGPPGVGKTRFAHFFAEQWQEPGGGGVAFVDARLCADTASLLDALGQALELPPVVALEEQSVSAQIAQALRERPGLLIVLDDVRNTDGNLARALHPLLDAPEVSWLQTSRTHSPLPTFAPMAIAPLSPEAAIALFEDRARRARPGFDASLLDGDLLDSLVRRLDYLPLAIELAAARLTILTPEDLLERLDQRFQILRPGHGTSDPTRTALGEAIAVSWAMLDDVQQSTLTQCAVFSGPFTLEDAEAVIELPDPTLWVGDVLQSLVLQSLVMTREDRVLRFFLLESIADFAKAHGKTEHLQQAEERHTMYFESCAGTWFEAAQSKEGDLAVDQLLHASKNIQAVADRLERVSPERALNLLCHLSPTFSVRGLRANYLRRLDALVEKLPDFSGPRVALTRSTLLASGGRLLEALAMIDETHAETSLLPEVLVERGRILRSLGRLTDARAAWEEVLHINDAPLALLQAQTELGLLALNRARFGSDDAALAEGVELLGSAYDLACRQAPALLRVQPTVGWALALHESGEGARALPLLQEERRSQHAAGYPDGVLHCDQHIAILEFYTGAIEQALQTAATVDGDLAQAGLEARRARNNSYRAIFANAAGHLEQARSFVNAALDASRQSGQTITTLIADVQGLMLAWEQEDITSARAHLERARSLAKGVDSRGHEAFLDAYQSFLLASRGECEEARTTWERARSRLMSAAEYRRPAHAPRGELVARAWRAVVELCCAPQHLDTANWPPLYEALATADSFAHTMPDPLCAVACRHAQQAADRVRKTYGLPPLPPTHLLRIHDQGEIFQLDDHEPVDLSNRAPLRRILVGLVERARAHAPSADLDSVVALGWPDEELEPQSAANRVYATIRMLRNMGLKEVLITDDGGYRIADDVLALFLDSK